jgi:hypothetical protein
MHIDNLTVVKRAEEQLAQCQVRLDSFDLLSLWAFLAIT